MLINKIERRDFLLSLGAFAAGPLARAQEPLRVPPAKFRGAIEKIDTLFAAEHARTGLASIVAGMVSGPDLIWSKTYGLADIDHGTPATTDNLYRIGSITKQFTDIAFLQLVRDGKVRLTDPVEKYLPEINLVQDRPVASPPITLIQLATHTSGLDREPQDAATYTRGPVAEWDKTLIEALRHTRYAYEPGTKQVYSNIAVGTLGLTLSRAAGVPYIEYVRRNIIEPLGLKNTSFEPGPELLKRVATGYELHDNKADSTVPTRELHTGRGYKVPNGALFTTIGDLGKWVSFELGHGPTLVIDKERLADNYSRIYSSNANLDGGYGIGFELRRKGNLIIAGHSGSVAGFQAGAYFHRPSDTGVIYLRNLGQGVRMDTLLQAFEALAV